MTLNGFEPQCDKYDEVTGNCIYNDKPCDYCRDDENEVDE